MRHAIPSEMRPEQVTAICDSREQLPLDLAPLRTERCMLVTGDYSVKGLVDVVAIERKSLSDLLACIGQERERFDREVLRLLAYPCRAIVVEATWGELERGGWRSKITPAAPLAASWAGLLLVSRSSWPATMNALGGTFPGYSSSPPGDDGGNSRAHVMPIVTTAPENALAGVGME